MLTKGDRRVSPFLVPMMMPNASGAAISMRYGFRGPNETITTACAASTHAIGYAARLISWGMCDAVVTGGTESAGCHVGVVSFGNMTALTTSGSSRPFDVDRDGFVLGEGAAVLVLEEWSAAERRGATIVGEILGAASNADAHHITAPAPGGTGAIACMRLALADAGLEPGDIGHINAHGTSTPLNDAAEAAAVTEVFGANAVPITSTKGVTGHALGAAGALEAVAMLLAMENRLIPPTAAQPRSIRSSPSTSSSARPDRGRRHLRSRTISVSVGTTEALSSVRRSRDLGFDSLGTPKPQLPQRRHQAEFRRSMETSFGGSGRAKR